jgi:hypothetical protein
MRLAEENDTGKAQPCTTTGAFATGCGSPASYQLWVQGGVVEERGRQADAVGLVVLKAAIFDPAIATQLPPRN